MLTCVYQPPLPLSKNCLLKVNRESKKVLVSKFSDEKGGRVKVEIASNHQDASLPETCGLSISELETMAARQARQLETQEQLLAAKAQRLRFLKSGGEAERLHRLRDKVATQEDRLRKLRALRGKVHNNRGANAALSSDLESLRAVFNEKEKELTVAVAKVEDLTRQLDDLRRGGKEPTNGQSAAAVELEKLRRELMYRQKLREAQATRVAAQRVALSQRQEEAMRIDRRIAELQERLHRKRLLNHQLAVTLKHQESVDEFVSVPTKNDPKYQTLPYNAKLFAPFANKHDRDNFEKSVQQMQIMHLDSQQPSQQQLDQQQQYHVQQQQQQQQQHQQSNKSNQILNYPSNNNNLQLNHLISQNQHNAKSANHPLPQQLSAPTLSQHHVSSAQQQQQQQQQSSSPVPPSNASAIPNGIQNVHNALGNPNMSWGKVISTGANNSSSHTNENIFPFTRPSNFGPTGAPASNATQNVPPSSNSSGLPVNNQLTGTKETSSGGSNVSGAGSGGSDGYAPAGHNGGLNIISGGGGRLAKPALPPKPAKPTPPPRGQGMQDLFSFNQRLPSSEREGSVGALSVMPDRTELPIKPKPLFLKKGNQNSSSSTTGSSNATSAVSAAEKEQSSGNSNNTTVRVSINRRIEMPPAFLFPESDPPPSDLVPEHQSGSSSVGGIGAGERVQHNQGQQNSTPGESSSSSRPQDEADSTALQKPSKPSLPEEYTLPDLFPHAPGQVGSNAANNNIINSGFSNLKNSNNQNNNNMSNLINSSGVPGSNNAPSTAELINNNNNILKEYKDSFFANLNQQQTMGGSGSSYGHNNTSSSTSSNLSSTTSSAMNNVNLIRATNINLSPNALTDSSGTQGDVPVNTDEHQRQQHLQQQQQQLQLDLENLNHVSVMSIQVSESSPTGDSKMDLSPIQLESYEVGNESPVVGIDHSGDRDEVASDSANSGSTITTTTSSVSSGSGVNVLRRVKKGNLKSNNKDHVPLGRRVSFDPLALLLDASLEGELDLVVKTAGEVGNASAANDEGITALHNAICAGHAEVVRFLVEFGCDVNAQDSDGWTPLHCAASCNNVGMVKFLVERGACIFATTLSDHETAAEKCEEDEDGFGPCSEYLYSIQEKLGIMNGGAVYSVFEYDAQNSDELTFRDGERLVILRKGDEYEREWWWASLGDKQGYVPRNLLGLYPRVVPHKRNES